MFFAFVSAHHVCVNGSRVLFVLCILHFLLTV